MRRGNGGNVSTRKLIILRNSEVALVRGPGLACTHAKAYKDEYKEELLAQEVSAYESPGNAGELQRIVKKT